MFARAYDELPKCNAPMNDFCIDVGDDDKVEASYICDEGTWVKGVDGSCLKGDENFNWGSLFTILFPLVEPNIKKLFNKKF